MTSGAADVSRLVKEEQNEKLEQLVCADDDSDALPALEPLCDPVEMIVWLVPERLWKDVLISCSRCANSRAMDIWLSSIAPKSLLQSETLCSGWRLAAPRRTFLSELGILMT